MDEQEEFAKRVAEARAQLPKCGCECGCQYTLMSTPSKSSGTCWSCRHSHHFGGTPMLSEEPE